MYRSFEEQVERARKGPTRRKATSLKNVLASERAREYEKVKEESARLDRKLKSVEEQLQARVHCA